jgi:hypothetical protein
MALRTTLILGALLVGCGGRTVSTGDGQIDSGAQTADSGYPACNRPDNACLLCTADGKYHCGGFAPDPVCPVGVAAGDFCPQAGLTCVSCSGSTGSELQCWQGKPMSWRVVRNVTCAY